ncbi:hypothetical protein Scep_002992 [Stephania cephalantha]|uniref:Smr domain-containing protein n=1 Tax=Stephania cephalantha TaxID=152367 RepID=A0AAP0Q9B5_9MAGN
MRDRVQKLWASGKSSGWAAFDHKQRQKQCLEPDLPTEPYPHISGVVNSVRPLKGSEHISRALGKSFSRAVQTPAFPSLILSNYETSSKGLMGSNSEGTGVIAKEVNRTPNLEKLKEVHSWADANLIEDILGAVNNDFDQASILLETMAATSSSEGVETIDLSGQRSPAEDSVLNKKAVQEFAALENKSNLREMKSVLEDCVDSNKTGEASEEARIEAMLSGSSTHSNSVPHPLVFAPIEPEWEEDDVYLTHRKHALKAIRSAAQHSRAASNAYLRGDHFSAKQLSQKAQGDWEVANMLNEKAAAEILSIRNSEVDVWKLDLHGLHASEAVRALQEHLRRIETNVPFNSPAPCRMVEPEAGLELSNSVGTMKTQKKQAWQGPRMLQVITGTGKHSRGEAALPSAIRSFLIENGYWFDEARPGVIAVRPKFRYT